MSDDDISSVIRTKLSPSGEPPELVQRMASLAMKARAGLPQPEFTSDKLGAVQRGLKNVAMMPVEVAKTFWEGSKTGIGIPNPLMGGVNVAKEMVVRPMAQQLSMATDTSRTPLERTGRALAGALPLVGPYAATVGERLGGEAPLEGAIETATEIGAGAGLMKVAPKMAQAVRARVAQGIEAVKNAPLELRSAIHDNALNVRDHVDYVKKSVQADISQQMEAVSKGVDAKTPQAVSAEPVRAEIRQDLGELVKVKETLPKSLQAILESTTKQPKTTGPAIMGRVMDLSNPADLIAFQRFKAQGIFSPEEIARIEGGTAKTNWGFEEAKQLRSDLGHELWGKATSMPGPVRSAATKAYYKMSDALAEAAEKAEMGKEWKSANDLNHQFMEDFWRSPVRKVIKGQNAAKIYEPLAGNPAEQVSRILDRYQNYGYNKVGVQESVKRFQKAQDAIKRGKASRYDVGIVGATIASAIFGKGFPVVGAAYEAARFGIPKGQQLAALKAAKKAEPLQTKARTQ